MSLTPGRTDQGYDLGGSGPVPAVAAGTVKSVGLWNGWPGSGGVVYSIANGRNIYVQEDFAPQVKAGQRVAAGQSLGVATGGSHGIEEGFANSAGSGPLVPYNGLADGTPTTGGQLFKQLFGAAAASPTKTASGGGGILSALDPTGGPLDPTGGPLDPSKLPDLNPVDAINALPGKLFDAAAKYALPVFLTLMLVLGGLAMIGMGVTHTLSEGKS